MRQAARRRDSTVSNYCCGGANTTAGLRFGRGGFCNRVVPGTSADWQRRQRATNGPAGETKERLCSRQGPRSTGSTWLPRAREDGATLPAACAVALAHFRLGPARGLLEASADALARAGGPARGDARLASNLFGCAPGDITRACFHDTKIGG